jgi:hypothetical protein
MKNSNSKKNFLKLKDFFETLMRKFDLATQLDNPGEEIAKF